MSLVFNRTLHTKLWLYIAEHCVSKETAVSKMAEKGLITAEEKYLLEVSTNTCLACEYADKLQDLLYDPYRNMCDFCPLVGQFTQHTCLRNVWYEFSVEQDLADKYSCQYTYPFFLYPVSSEMEYMLSTTYPTIYYNALRAAPHRKIDAIYARTIAHWPVKENVVCI